MQPRLTTGGPVDPRLPALLSEMAGACSVETLAVADCLQGLIEALPNQRPTAAMQREQTARIIDSANLIKEAAQRVLDTFQTA